MEFKWHFSIGFLVSVILVYSFDFSIYAGIIIFVASWAIDIDHYFWFAVYTKDLNPFSAIKWHFKEMKLAKKLTKEKKLKYAKGVFIFHSLPVLLILYLLSFLSNFFLFILIGFIIHLVVDWIDLFILGEPFYIKTFPCLTIIKNKNKKPLGM